MFGFVSGLPDRCLSDIHVLSQQAQLVPQLIINYKLKVRHLEGYNVNESNSAYIPERRPHANEGHEDP